jgi:hypothetical protein
MMFYALLLPPLPLLRCQRRASITTRIAYCPFSFG